MRTALFEKYIDSGLMSQKELARLIGMSEENLSRIRTGRVSISEGFVARVCLALHAPRELLFFEEEAEAVAGHRRA
ncbi:MAG: helix-turn-helix domain-containing protein [Acidiferrobacterales bacterium]